MVLKSSISTSASPWRQWSHWGLRVTQNAYFSLLTHTKQLLLVTFCDTTAGNSVSFRTHRRTNERTDGQTDAGWTDRRGSRNSYLDGLKKQDFDLLHFYGDCTIASLTISDVHLVYCEVDMPIGTPSL